MKQTLAAHRFAGFLIVAIMTTVFGFITLLSVYFIGEMIFRWSNGGPLFPH